MLIAPRATENNRTTTPIASLACTCPNCWITSGDIRGITAVASPDVEGMARAMIAKIAKIIIKNAAVSIPASPSDSPWIQKSVRPEYCRTFPIAAAIPIRIARENISLAPAKIVAIICFHVNLNMIIIVTVANKNTVIRSPQYHHPMAPYWSPPAYSPQNMLTHHGFDGSYPRMSGHGMNPRIIIPNANPIMISVALCFLVNLKSVASPRCDLAHFKSASMFSATQDFLLFL